MYRPEQQPKNAGKPQMNSDGHLAQSATSSREESSLNQGNRDKRHQFKSPSELTFNSIALMVRSSQSQKIQFNQSNTIRLAWDGQIETFVRFLETGRFLQPGLK